LFLANASELFFQRLLDNSGNISQKNLEQTKQTKKGFFLQYFLAFLLPLTDGLTFKKLPVAALHTYIPRKHTLFTLNGRRINY
jgi:hypothetical protein